MDLDDKPKNNSPQSPSSPKLNSSQKSSLSFFSPNEVVVIYSVVSILFVMKKSLGLEAMLDYMKKFLNLIDQNNPSIKLAVAKALSLMNVEKMYRDAMDRNDEEN